MIEEKINDTLLGKQRILLWELLYNFFNDYVHNYSSLWNESLMLSYLESICTVLQNSNLFVFCK